MTEIVPKFQRIQELYEMGFNTPRLKYIPPDFVWDKKSSKDVDRFIHRAGKQGFINIRTYSRTSIIDESWSSKHHTFVLYDNAVPVLKELCSQGIHSMIDIENPKNGLFAGNVMINNTPDIDFTVEYCCNLQGGAMVRAADISVSGALEDKRTLRELPSEVVQAVNIAYNRFTKPYKTVILEWSRTSVPAGERMERYIWWEYRNLSK